MTAEFSITEQPKARKRGRPPLGEKSAREIVKAAGTNETYYRLACRLRRDAPDLADRVSEGTLKLPAAIRALSARQKENSVAEAATHAVDQRLSASRKAIEALAKKVAAAADNPPNDPWLDDDALSCVRRNLMEAATTLRSLSPGAPCPYCMGDRCSKCRQTGYIPQWFCGPAEDD